MKNTNAIPAKKKDEKANVFLRNISKEIQKKFKANAKKLGYKQREYFELIVKGL